MTNEMTEIKVRMFDEFEGVPFFLRGIAHDEMIRVWNIGADASEELYKKWNSEFESLYGAGHWEDQIYYDFIADKWRKWYPAHVNSVLFDLEKTEFEEAQAFFKIRGLPKSRVGFYVKIVD